MGAFKNLANILKYGFYFVLFGLVFSAGWITRSKTIKIPDPIEHTEYVPSDPVHDTLWQDKPYYVSKPVDTLNIIEACIKNGIYQELWPEKLVTEYVEINKADTTAILKDWATERKYSERLFTADTLGTLDIDASVQYNRLRYVDYTFTPMTKEHTNTIYTAKYFSPFAGGGVMINPWDTQPDFITEVNGGVFVADKYGIQLKYQRGFKSNNDYIGASLLYKF